MQFDGGKPGVHDGLGQAWLTDCKVGGIDDYAVHTIRLQEPINGFNEAHRIVLGSWDSKGWVVEFTAAGFDLKHFPHTAA